MRVHFDHQRWSETVMYLLIEIFIHPSVSKPHATFGLINRQTSREKDWNISSSKCRNSFEIILLSLSNAARSWFISAFLFKTLNLNSDGNVRLNQPNCNAKRRNSLNFSGKNQQKAINAKVWEEDVSEIRDRERERTSNRRKQNKCLADKWIKLQMD